jgi:hypothetical protein
MMNLRQQQLKEKDVRHESPELDPNFFLAAYLKSNFPQTAAYQSDEQKNYGIIAQPNVDGVEYNKKPRSGTSFDNPASY